MRAITKTLFYILLPILTVFSVAPFALAHCEIPCGIYDDEARFAEMRQDIATIEKGMVNITDLSQNSAVNMNQIVRWVENKDLHANRIKQTVANYFLSQRVKKPAHGDQAGDEAYILKLKLLHQLTVAAMHAKQTTDLKYVEELKQALQVFEELYFAAHTHPHEAASG